MTILGDCSSLINSVRWTEEALYLKEFVHKTQLPRVVRIVKGQYLNLGCPSLANGALQQHLLVVSLGKRKRLLAQSVKFKERKIVPVGQKIALPANYDGFLEILSEDGRSVRCIESVAELCKRFPDSVLVREDVRAYVSKSDDIDSIKDRSRTISSGETLILVGEVLAVKGKLQSRFLRCFDCNGENVYLPYELKSKFSAIAKEDNISGVHSVNNLLNKRLPVMARLVHGKGPVGMKSAFVPEMRLLAAMEEDFLVGLVLSKDVTHVVPLPAMALIKVQTATNVDEINQRIDFLNLIERCQKLSADLPDEITIHDVAFGRDLRLNGDKMLQNQQHNRRRAKRSSQLFNPAALLSNNKGGHDGGGHKDDYDEIEQIYDYVRGFAPLPRSARGWKYEVSKKGDGGDTPPEPPPIDTIPSGRPSMDPHTPPHSPPISAVWETYNATPLPSANSEAKKRQRENVYPSMTRFVSNKALGPKHRFFRHQKKDSLMSSGHHTGVRPSTSMTLSRSNLYSPTKPSSPASFFQLRYKSLNNLAATCGGVSSSPSAAEYDTLDSSKTMSGDSSGASRTLPEKRSRKLSRPKSLTNLMMRSYSTLPSPTSGVDHHMGHGKYHSHHADTRNSHHQVMHHSSKMGSNNAKRISTLYL